MTHPPQPSRRLVNKIFGETLPEVAPSERDEASPEEASEHDRWLQNNIPPHHG
jgi:hypothetical protein